MSLLILSDLHCTDLPRDSSRFKLFPWLRQQQDQFDVDITIIAGDLTEAKDRHSSALVNKLVESLLLLKPPVLIPIGNHDFIDPQMPFFKFVSELDGITVYTKPSRIKFRGTDLVFIPHQPNQASLNTAFKTVTEGCLVFMHNTIGGAISELGGHLAGLALPPEARQAKTIYSGDIHKPQVVNSNGALLTYIGAPFHIKHGDQYTPRVLLRDNYKETNLYFDAPKKLSLIIRDLSEMPELKKGDQVKVTLELPRSEAVEWANHKKSILDYCKDKGVEVYGTELRVAQARKRQRLDDTPTNRSNLDYFKTFCAAEQVPSNIKTVGLQLVESGGSNG